MRCRVPRVPSPRWQHRGGAGATTYSCLVGGIVKSRLHGDMVIRVGASKGQLQRWLPLKPVGKGQLEWAVGGPWGSMG